MYSPKRMWRRFVGLAALSILVSPSHAMAASAPLSLHDRVACRLAIEEVYRADRVAFAERNGEGRAKRPLSLDAKRVALQVEEDLRRETALAKRYRERLDAVARQHELDRIARQTRAPAQLARLLAALDHDARLAGECIARPALVQRRLAQRVAHDHA